jgi:uncharacterized protein
MQVQLTEKPHGVTIVQGFPGFGMVGSIATEFLIGHSAFKQIGSFIFDEVQPLIAIHGGKLVPPAAIYYCEAVNLVVLSFMIKGKNHEWKFANAIQELADTLSAKEIITIEGVTGLDEKHPLTFYSTQEVKHPLSEKGYEVMQESIIMGVSAALLVQDGRPITAIFANSNPQIPDSNAAAEVIKALDAYLNLDIDYEPLHEQASEFEGKLKAMFAKSEQAINDKSQDYVS